MLMSAHYLLFLKNGFACLLFFTNLLEGLTNIKKTTRAIAEYFFCVCENLYQVCEKAYKSEVNKKHTKMSCIKNNKNCRKRQHNNILLKLFSPPFCTCWKSLLSYKNIQLSKLFVNTKYIKILFLKFKIYWNIYININFSQNEKIWRMWNSRGQTPFFSQCMWIYDSRYYFVVNFRRWLFR